MLMLPTERPIKDLDQIMHSMQSYAQGVNGMGYSWIREDAEDDPLDTELLTQIEQVIQHNTLLIQQRHQLRSGPFGLAKGRFTVMVLSIIGACAWVLDLGASIWEEVQDDNENKAIAFTVVPLNLIAIALAGLSAWAWARYAGHVKKVAKAKPIADSELERARRIQNALTPLQQFLSNRDAPEYVLVKHLQHFDREYEYLPEHIQQKYPKAGTIGLLIGMLDINHPLRQQYDEAAAAARGLAPLHHGLDPFEEEGSPRHTSRTPRRSASLDMEAPDVVGMGSSYSGEKSGYIDEYSEQLRSRPLRSRKAIRSWSSAAYDSPRLSALAARQNLERIWGIPLNVLMFRGVAVDRAGEASEI